MGIAIFSNGGKTAYGVKHFIIDTDTEIENLTTDCFAGSTAFVVATSETYMLNNNKTWVKIENNNFNT